MKLFWVAALAAAGLCAAPKQVTTAQETNVNTRYAVESIEVLADRDIRLSRGLQDEIRRLTGARLDVLALEELAKRIRVELNVSNVDQRLVRGRQRDSVRVVYEITPERTEIDASVPRLLYHSRQGFTGEAEVSATYGPQRLSLGIISDADELPERNSGMRLRYDTTRVGTRRLRAAFVFESLRQQWDPAIEAAADGIAPLYRTRHMIEPTLTVVLAGPLTWTSGFSFAAIENQFPAARTSSAHAVVNTLRYHRQWEGLGATTHLLDAGYSLRAATSILGSDYLFTRHHWHAAYSATRGRHTVLMNLAAGRLTGAAPIYERFVAGNSSTLRGWNKLDLVPFGGARIVHQTVEYRYRLLQAFYDTGCVWALESPEGCRVRHSVGVGMRKDRLMLAVAFPVKSGRIEPMLMTGLTF